MQILANLKVQGKPQFRSYAVALNTTKLPDMNLNNLQTANTSLVCGQFLEGGETSSQMAETASGSSVKTVPRDKRLVSLPVQVAESVEMSEIMQLDGTLQNSAVMTTLRKKSDQNSGAISRIDTDAIESALYELSRLDPPNSPLQKP